MLYRITKVVDENLYVKAVSETIDLIKVSEYHEVFGRVLGYRYYFVDGDYCTGGGFESLYKDAEGNIYFDLPEELIKDVFTWMDIEKQYDYIVPDGNFHEIIQEA